MSSPFGKKKTEEKKEIVDDIGKKIDEITKELPFFEAGQKEEENEEEIEYEPEEEEERKTPSEIHEIVKKPKKKIKIKKNNRLDKKVIEKIQEKPKKKLKEKHKKKLKIKRKPFDWNRGLLYLMVFGIIGIIFFTQSLEQINQVAMWIMVLFGMMCFFPLGFLLGKLLLDPYIRCKIYRRMGNRNFGMVHIIQKGGRKVEIRIKNLTDDVIIQGTKLWVLEEGGIYYTDRDDNLILHAEVKPENFVTSPNNVPILFLDADNMLPLTFFKPNTISNPQQVGATVLGYINNQIAKNLFFKKSMTFFYTILLILQAMNLIGLIVLYDELVGL